MAGALLAQGARKWSQTGTGTELREATMTDIQMRDNAASPVIRLRAPKVVVPAALPVR